jgi:GTPase SAR1 family protein
MHASGQALHIKRRSVITAFEKLKWRQYKKRLSGTPAILSSSEVSALYHFPFSGNNQTEDLIRVRSKELPAPLSVKNNPDLDVVFGKNTFGNTETDIGLTDDDRSRHVYLIGQTGSGKSTIIYHMAKDDIKKGRGLTVVDPHGDLAEGLLDTIPNKRIEDVIYFNPFDIKYPVGINLLELNDNLEDDELELEKELVCESVVSIFRRVFFKDESTDAHRIEYILRNAIYTAFTIPNRTIFTVYDLLNDTNFRKSAIKNLEDENLIKFWKNEFGKAGDYQHVKMVSGVTAKVGRFLFSPIAKRILEQSNSTINFDEILNNGKVLLCNLAEGKLGEDTSMLLGATVIAKVHQAAVRRARISSTDRKPFYLFVDEFQNFATSSFTKLLSGGRKFGLRITIAEQSTSQQDNRNVTNVVLANTGTVICFRTASPVDEELMLSQFAPQVVQGDIGNLPRYRFYMRLAAIEPEAPFSGITIPITTETNQAKKDYLIESSRKNYAIQYVKKPSKPTPPSAPEKPIEAKKKSAKPLESAF